MKPKVQRYWFGVTSTWVWQVVGPDRISYHRTWHAAMDYANTVARAHGLATGKVLFQ